MKLKYIEEGEVMRVWTEAMEAYGQFEVMDRADFEVLQKHPNLFMLEKIED